MGSGHDHHAHGGEDPSPLLQRAMAWSVGLGILLLLVKVAAAWLTGSTALYGDAAESVVHVLATVFASFALRWSRKPADDKHHFGHEKAAYLSGGLEGAMVAATAILVAARAVQDLITGPEIGKLGLGAALATVTVVVNGALGFTLQRLGRRHDDRVVRANGTHVLADVWTTGAGLAALGLVALTGALWWDPVIALLFSAWILWQGAGLVREAFHGLMDSADPAVEGRLVEVLERHQERGLSFAFHNLRHRNSGLSHWVELHLVFDHGIDLETAHRRATEIEHALAEELGGKTQIISHLEPRSAVGQDQVWETAPGEGPEKAPGETVPAPAGAQAQDTSGHDHGHPSP